MKHPMIKRGFMIGIILLSIGATNLPISNGTIDEKKCMFQGNNFPRAMNETIPDYLDDVITIDYITGETMIITNSTEIEVDNLDLVQATITQIGLQVTLCLQVAGRIEDRGELLDPYANFTDIIDMVEYGFELLTSDDEYMINYCNQTGQLISGGIQMNLTSSDFFVVNDTLSFTFSLINPDEIYEELRVSTTFIKANFSNMTSVVYLADRAPNPPLEIHTHAPSIGFIKEPVQFQGQVYPLTGTPPYTYHWDFGDQETSTVQNPIHIYTNAGFYLYTFIVTDRTAAQAYKSGWIIIYELKRTVMIGSYTNWTTQNGLTTIDTVHLWTLQLKPFSLELNIPPEKITFSDKWVGMRTKNRIAGIFEVVLPQSAHNEHYDISEHSNILKFNRSTRYN